MSKHRIVEGTTAGQNIAQKPCSVSGCETKTAKECTRCEKPFCDTHLYQPANELVSGMFACGPCAKHIHEISFADTVGRALTLLFSTGLRGVTIYSPNGMECYYPNANIESGIVTGTAYADLGPDAPAASVTYLDTGEVALQGIFSRELLMTILADRSQWKT